MFLEPKTGPLKLPIVVYYLGTHVNRTRNRVVLSKHGNHPNKAGISSMEREQTHTLFFRFPVYFWRRRVVSHPDLWHTRLFVCVCVCVRREQTAPQTGAAQRPSFFLFFRHWASRCAPPKLLVHPGTLLAF